MFENVTWSPFTDATWSSCHDSIVILFWHELWFFGTNRVFSSRIVLFVTHSDFVLSGILVSCLESMETFFSRFVIYRHQSCCFVANRGFPVTKSCAFCFTNRAFLSWIVFFLSRIVVFLSRIVTSCHESWFCCHDLWFCFVLNLFLRESWFSCRQSCFRFVPNHVFLLSQRVRFFWLSQINGGRLCSLRIDQYLSRCRELLHRRTKRVTLLSFIRWVPSFALVGVS